jgi:hypothetical protein
MGDRFRRVQRIDRLHLACDRRGWLEQFAQQQSADPAGAVDADTVHAKHPFIIFDLCYIIFKLNRQYITYYFTKNCAFRSVLFRKMAKKYPA